MEKNFGGPNGIRTRGFSLERKLGVIFIKWLLATVSAQQNDFKTENVFLYIPAVTVKSA